MEYRDAAKQMIAAYPGGWPAMAAALGISQASLENRVYERKGQTLSVHIMRQMQAISGTQFFAMAAAKEAGGTFVALPSLPDLGNEELFKKFLTLNAKLGELSREYQDATADDEVDNREWERLSRISDEIHRAVMEIMAITDKVFRKGSEGI